MYFPGIQSLSCYWTAQLSGSVSSTNTIFEGATGSSYVKYTNTTLNASYITGIVLTNDATVVRGITTLTFPSPISASLNCYVHYSSNFTNLQDSTSNSITAYYSNYSGYSLSTCAFTTFLTAGPPSAPISITSSSSSSINVMSELITIITGTWSDSTNQNNTYGYATYQCFYYSTAQTNRYLVSITQATLLSPLSNVATSNPFTLSSLYPESTYSITAQVSNTALATTYSAASASVTFTTGILPPTITSFTQPSTLSLVGTTLYSGRLVGTNGNSIVYTNIVSNIIFGTVSTSTSTSLVCPIQCSNTRGSISSRSTPLLTVAYTLINSASTAMSSTITYYGFGSTRPSPITTTSSPITMNATVAIDAYSNRNIEFQNYYQTTSHNVTLNINSTNFTPSNNINQLTLVQTQLGGSAINSSTSTLISFYYDTILTAPVINSFTSIISAGTFTCISGIYILSTSISFNTNTNIASGIGNYFYNPTQILTYSVSNNGSVGSITSSGSETSLSNASSSSSSIIYSRGSQNCIIYPITFSNGLVNGTISTSTYGTSIYVGVTAYNVDTYSTTYTTPNAYNVIIDQPSYDLISNPTTTPVSIPSASGGLPGYKIYSGASSNNGTNGLPNLLVTGNSTFYTNVYDHTQSIATAGNYDQDLQLCNGAYSTYGSGNSIFRGYRNYLSGAYYSSPSGSAGQHDYNAISKTTDSYRWSTFVWRCPTKLSGNSLIVFNITGLVSNGSPITNITDIISQPTFDSQKIKVYYRFEDASNTALVSGGKNTSWINGTTATPPKISSGNYWYLAYEISGQDIDNQTITSLRGSTLPINCVPPSFTIASNDTIYLYCAVGLNMSTNIGFRCVTAMLS